MGLAQEVQDSIPGIVTEGYLATVLRMEANSARANVLPYLKTLGIINADGKTTERATKWRDDARYPAVCKEILKEVYPTELLDAVTDATQREQAESWFANATSTGEGAVRRMAALYEVLLEADASKQPDERGDRARPEKKPAKAATSKPAPIVPATIIHEPHRHAGSTLPPVPQLPGININLEIHISADSTPDQIDAIFAGMAKHIYKNG